MRVLFDMGVCDGKLYIVYQLDGYDVTPIAYFSSKKKADRFCDLKSEYESDDYTKFYVSESILNPDFEDPGEGMKLYELLIAKGPIVHNIDNGPYFIERTWKYNYNAHFLKTSNGDIVFEHCIWARNEEDAKRWALINIRFGYHEINWPDDLSDESDIIYVYPGQLNGMVKELYESSNRNKQRRP